MLINQQLFTEVARNGVPKMNPYSREYDEWWKEEYRRCKYGLEIGGRKMSGRLYFYLNYCTIEAIEKNTNRKRLTRPWLRDVEWEVFDLIEQCDGNGDPNAPKKGLIWITGRRVGKSYVVSACGSHEYTFYKDAEIVIGAYESRFSDPLMQKVKIHLDGLQKTAPQFYQKRIKDVVTSEFRAGYQAQANGTYITKGSNSRIHNIKFKQNHTAANGKTSKLFIWEEIGMFNNLKKAYQSAEPCWKEGSQWFGFPLMIGTGGDMDAGSLDAQEMFYEPETYNLLAFKDDDGDKNIGYFLPASKGDNTCKYLDKDGITMVTDIKKAEKAQEEARESKKKSKDPNELIKHMQYYPMVPGEAFMVSSGNIFPQDLIQKRINYLMTNKKEANFGRRGKLLYEHVNGKKTLKFYDDVSLKEAAFPTKRDDREGCIIIYESPEKNPPSNLYIAALDPYKHDEATRSDSVGALTIYKRFYSANKTYEFPVAEYYGRPDTLENFYLNVGMLLEYYNASCLYENEVTNTKPEMKRLGFIKYLAKQPQLTKQIMPNSKVERTLGIHMTTQIRHYGESKLKDWLKERTGDGKTNVDKIYSIPLLKELVQYNAEGNFDRVDSMLLLMIYREELHEVSVKESKSDSPESSIFSGLHKKFG